MLKGVKGSRIYSCLNCEAECEALRNEGGCRILLAAMSADHGLWIDCGFRTVTSAGEQRVVNGECQDRESPNVDEISEVGHFEDGSRID
jgi:hypothetical protein